jgi:hypothetical protein
MSEFRYNLIPVSNSWAFAVYFQLQLVMYLSRVGLVEFSSMVFERAIVRSLWAIT